MLAAPARYESARCEPYPCQVADDDTPVTVNRIERVLAFMVVSIIALAVICFIAVVVGSANDVDFTVGLWPIVFVMPGVGLPIGVLLILTLLVVNLLRRRRESRDADGE